MFFRLYHFKMILQQNKNSSTFLDYYAAFKASLKSLGFRILYHSSIVLAAVIAHLFRRNVFTEDGQFYK